MDEVLYDPLSLELREDPYPICRRLRAEAPVYHDHPDRLLLDDPDLMFTMRGSFEESEGGGETIPASASVMLQRQGAGKAAGAAVKRPVKTASAPVVPLDLPLVWVTWCVPRGLLYRHEEDEGESSCDGRRGNAIQHALRRKESR